MPKYKPPLPYRNLALIIWGLLLAGIILWGVWIYLGVLLIKQLNQL